MTTSRISSQTLTDADIDKLMDEDNERDAVNGGQEPGDEIEQPQRREPEPRAEDEPEEKTKPIPMSPQDEKRAKMAERFKRPDTRDEFDGDMTKNENLYGDVALDIEPEAPVAQEPAPQPVEKKHKIIVRQKEMWLTEAELLERASKVEAADSYLEEGRNLLEQAKAVRDGRSAQHPEQRSDAQDDGQDRNDRQETRRPGIDLKAVVEKIQYGDPDEAANDLAVAIETAADNRANEAHVKRLVSTDLARSKSDLAAFIKANPELQADEIASNAIENLVYSIYRDELKALGLDETQIPKDPKSLADKHRLHRVHDHPVSRPADVLEKAKAKYEQWRGVSPSKPKAPAPQGTGAPRVSVNVDRTDRRMAIPTQPSRGVAPRRDAAPVAQESSRKSAVQEMRRSRGQIV
jgi:hypothetical protein